MPEINRNKNLKMGSTSKLSGEKKNSQPDTFIYLLFYLFIFFQNVTVHLIF